jgi:hypothetical protein
MSAKPVRVCPACRGVTRSRPLPPQGFWQVQILQRLRMYPYRCEGCGARFYRRVEVSQNLLASSRKRSDPRPMRQGPAHAFRAESTSGPKGVATREESLDGERSHQDFVELIGHVNRPKQRQDLKTRDESDGHD